MSEHTAESVAGIQQASEPCWFPMDGTEQAFEWGEGTPHWTTIEAATEGMATIVSEHIADGFKHPDITLHRESEGCWHLICAECGYRYDEDEWVSHFPDRREAENAAEDSDWRVVDGRALCPECTPSAVRGEGGEE